MFCLFTGCQRIPSTEEAALDPNTRQTPDTARIICDPNGVSVLTPRVESRPDGVHLAIDNRLEGKVEIDCYSRSWGRDKLFGMEAGAIEVLAGDSGYKSTKLDCPRDKKIEPFTKEEMEEQRGDPVEIFRRSHSDSLREGDIVASMRNCKTIRARSALPGPRGQQAPYTEAASHDATWGSGPERVSCSS